VPVSNKRRFSEERYPRRSRSRSRSRGRRDDSRDRGDDRMQGRGGYGGYGPGYPYPTQGGYPVQQQYSPGHYPQQYAQSPHPMSGHSSHHVTPQGSPYGAGRGGPWPQQQFSPQQ
jgi:hypothetical protein